MQKALNAAHAFSKLDQEGTDRIVRAVYEACFENRWRLAEMAHEETGIGNVHDKVVKNIIASRFVYRDIKNQKSVGVLSRDEDSGITEIARPMGPVFAITPITNPTSTAIFKTLNCHEEPEPHHLLPAWFRTEMYCGGCLHRL